MTSLAEAIRDAAYLVAALIIVGGLWNLRDAARQT